MDKRLKQRILTLYADGLNAHDIMRQHNRQTHDELAVTTIEAVLRQYGVPDPSHRIPQKPDIQPDMPKRFIPVTSATTRKKLTYQQSARAKEQKEWHQIACGFSANGRKLLKSNSRHMLERKIVEQLEKGYVQIGDITADFYCDGETYMALVEKKEDPQ